MMNKRYKSVILAMAVGLTSLFVTASGSGLAMAEVAEVPGASLAADPIALYGNQADYIVYRDGGKVGNHKLTFRQTGDTLNVEVKSALTVRVLRIPVFRFRYDSSETWVDGKLQQATSTIQENSKKKTVSMRSDADYSVLKNPNGSRKVPRLAYTSNHWLMSATESGRMFNTLTGKASTVDVQSLGAETFRTAKGSIEAHRYRYSGGVKADVWYDSESRWVGLQFEADDGSKIVYRANF